MTSPVNSPVGDPQSKPGLDIDNLKPADVNTIHRYDDVDRDDSSHHHSLGTGPSQAAPGNHSGHMVGTTKPTVIGSRGGNAALASLLTALASRGIITDGTTA